MQHPDKWRYGSLFILSCLLLAACQSQSSGSFLPTIVPTASFSSHLTAPAASQASLPAVQPTYTPRLTAPAAIPPPVTPQPTRPACQEPGRVVQSSYDSTAAGGPMAYRIYLPPCYGRDGRSYPALYLLPGNIYDDRIWDELGIDEAAEAGIAAGQLPPLIIVMADGGAIANNSSGGSNSFEGVILTDLIPHIEQNYCAWAAGAGRAIGGLSRGGYWALEIAFRQPELFVSVGGHSAALLDVAAGADINPQQTGLTQPLGDLRIYLDIGADDYLIGNIRQLHEDLAAAGIAHTWLLNEGRHEEAYWQAHIPAYLAWYTAPWPAARHGYPPCSQPILGPDSSP